MKKTPIHRISPKRRKQLIAEIQLTKVLFKKQGGLCAKCHKPLDWHWAGFDKHEIKRRSQGGDPLDEMNCELLCRLCHIEETEYREVKS